ncbi:MAG: methyl-accepting chemotaxis protein [Bacillota bacterium]|nr:methyl-accepting chemotaxis protein [Bacillota bacterium]
MNGVKFFRSGSEDDLKATNDDLDHIIKNVSTLKDAMKIESEKKAMDGMIADIKSYKTNLNNYATALFQQNEERGIFTMKQKAIEIPLDALYNEQNNELTNLIQNAAEMGLINKKQESVILLNDALTDLKNMGIEERNFIINLADSEGQELYYQNTLDEFKATEDLLKELKTTFKDQQDINKVDEILTALAEGKTAFENIYQSELTRDESYAVLVSLGGEIAEDIQELSDVKEQEVADAVTSSSRNLFIAAAVALVLGVIIAVFITRSITKPVNAGVDYAREIADGNFDLADIQVKTMDEIGILVTALNNLRNKLNQSLVEIQNIGVNVNNGSDEIAQGNQDLSQRTQEQASALEELSATIEEITSSIANVAENSKKADNLSNNAMKTVKEGSEVVGQTMKSMKAITASSKEIADITDVVNDIAFQTNLLALNAAVEAARAGEHGKGFAVVAAEVRNLASRTSESSKEIEKLISEIIKQIEDGNNLVAKTGETLEEITENSEQTSSAISEIAGAMNEQSSAANQIQGAVEELDQVTQQNASMVEEIASSSETLNSEAQTLADIVNEFRLENINNRFSNQKNKQVKSNRSNRQQFKSKKSNKPNLDDEMADGFDSDDFDTF